MAPTTNKTLTFGRIADRIREFLFPLFRSNQSGKRRKDTKVSTPEYLTDLLTVDLPLKSLEDELYWDAVEGESEVMTLASPAAVNLREEAMNDEIFYDLLDRFGAREPFFILDFDQNPVTPPPPAFHLFSKLPFELRLKVWHFTILPRVVHYNILGARRSNLNIDRQLPIVLQVCQESRYEGLRIFDISPNATRPFFFNPKSDTLLWTRYPNCPNTVAEDAARLLNSSILRGVQHLAIANHYWNKLLSDEGPKVAYTAIRKAANLEVLTLVDDYFVRRHGARGLTLHTCGMVMKLIDIPPGECGVRKVGWRKEVQREGAEKVWEKWDVNLTDSEGLPRRRVPEIRFARAVLEKP